MLRNYVSLNSDGTLTTVVGGRVVYRGPSPVRVVSSRDVVRERLVVVLARRVELLRDTTTKREPSG